MCKMYILHGFFISTYSKDKGICVVFQILWYISILMYASKPALTVNINIHSQSK